MAALIVGVNIRIFKYCFRIAVTLRPEVTRLICDVPWHDADLDRLWLGRIVRPTASIVVAPHREDVPVAQAAIRRPCDPSQRVRGASATSPVMTRRPSGWLGGRVERDRGRII